LNSVLKPNSSEAVRVRPWRLRLQGWVRWLHVYTSMVSLMVVLFFSLTGVTLNHPDWLFGTQEIRSEYTGTLPTNWRKGNGVDWFVVAEDIRATHGIKGRAIDQQSSQTDASLRFAAPGYTADVLIEQSGKYTVRLSSQGWVAALNDFHRGRNAGAVWARANASSQPVTTARFSPSNSSK
jgi:uncharacterized protein